MKSGRSFQRHFWPRLKRTAVFFRPGQGDRLLFDLKGYVARRLVQAGVKDIHPLPCDTFREEKRFFSYRRASKNGEPDYGRALSAIALVE